MPLPSFFFFDFKREAGRCWCLFTQLGLKRRVCDFAAYIHMRAHELPAVVHVVSPKLDRLIFWVETLFAVVPTVYMVDGKITRGRP